MEGVSKITAVLFFVAFGTLFLIRSASGLKCYSCSGKGGPDIKGRCQNSQGDEMYKEWKEIDCSHTGLNTCLYYYNVDDRPRNVTQGCGTASDAIEGCDIIKKDDWYNSVLHQVCHCKGDLCNWNKGTKPPDLKCHVCGGSSNKSCPDSLTSNQLRKVELVSCTDGVPGIHRMDGVCQSIRSHLAGKYTLACVLNTQEIKLEEDHPWKNIMTKKCREESEGTVCYCQPGTGEDRTLGCIPEEIKKSPPKKNSGEVTASLSFPHVMFLPSVIYFFMGATTSIGY